MTETVQNVLNANTPLGDLFAKRASDKNSAPIIYLIGRKVYVIVRTISSLYVRIRDVFSKVHFNLDYDITNSFSYHDDTPSPDNHQYPLREVPTWASYQFKSRTGKIMPKTSSQHCAIHRISNKLFNSFRKDTSAPSPIDTVKFGAGIANGNNCCFMASVIQALRLSPSFRARIRSADLRQSPVAQELRKIYGIIEGRGQPKRALTGDEINAFRQVCIEAGFQIDNAMTQEDTSHFCQFLLYQIGQKEFPICEYNEHNFDIEVNALKKPPLSENLVVLQVANTHEEVSEIKQLVSERTEIVEVEPRLIRKDYSEKNLLTPEIEEKLKGMKEVEQVLVKQSLQLFGQHIPHVLPIYLERGDYDRDKKQYFINNRKIAPTTLLEFPLADQPGFAARYEFISAVTREQALSDDVKKSLNKESGHYAAWSKFQHNESSFFAEYNSSSSRLHTTTADKALDGIKQNSRLYLYEFVGVVQNKQ